MKLLIVACFVALAYASPVELTRKTLSHGTPDYFDFKCEGLNGFFADRVGGCRQYYECKAGVKSETLDCPEGQVFNEDLWACDLAALYSCPSPAKRSLDLAKKTPSHGAPDWLNFKCEGLDDGFYPDLMRGCHQYYKCTGGVKETFFCTQDTIFNKVVNACYSKSLYSCPALEKRDEAAPEHMAFRCENRKNGFYPSRRCEGFYRCDAGKKFTFSCPAGTLFDTSLNVCNHKGLVNRYTCKPRTQEGPSSEEKRDEAAPEHMAFRCENRKNGFYPSRRCEGFYRCDAGKRFTFSCPAGTLFDTSLNVCNHKGLVNRYTCKPRTQERPSSEEKLEKLRELVKELRNIK